jgi:hypothetical protein
MDWSEVGRHENTTSLQREILRIDRRSVAARPRGIEQEGDEREEMGRGSDFFLSLAETHHGGEVVPTWVRAVICLGHRILIARS